MNKYYLTLAVLLAGAAPYAFHHVATPAYAQSEEGNAFEEETAEEIAAREAAEAEAARQAEEEREAEAQIPVINQELNDGTQLLNTLGQTGATVPGASTASQMEQDVDAAIDAAETVPEAAHDGMRAGQRYTN